MINELNDFIVQERRRFNTRHNNMFAFSFGEILRYLQYINLIYKRYLIINKEYMELVRNELDKVIKSKKKSQTRTLTQEEVNSLNKQRALQVQVQLEIESFYLFAKILLDKISRAIEFYFGSARRLSLDSHDDFVKNFVRYKSVKKLKVKKGYKLQLKELKKKISDFRDYQIAHEKSPRSMRGMLFDNKNRTRIIVHKLYPTEKDVQKESDFLDDLTSSIADYIRGTIELVNANNSKTNLELNNEQ